MSAVSDVQCAPLSPTQPLSRWSRHGKGCASDVTCTPTQLRWQRWQPAPGSACSLLDAAGISVLHFVGDSFARHAYVALLLQLSDNPSSGALLPEHNATCRVEGQFSERECRGQLARDTLTCGGSVRLRYFGTDAMPTFGFMHCIKLSDYDCHRQHNTGNFPLPAPSDWDVADAVVWGIGRHRVPGRSQLGAYNASGIQERVLASMCQSNASRRALIRRKLVWLDSPARAAPPLSDSECPARIASFNDGMRLALRDTCHVSRVASIWSATHSLMHTPGSAWEQLTYDGVHWGMPVSMLYADAIMEQLVDPPARQSLSSPAHTPLLSAAVSLGVEQSVPAAVCRPGWAGCRCAGSDCVPLEASPISARMRGCAATNGSMFDPQSTTGAHDWPWPLSEMPIGRWNPLLANIPPFLRLYDWYVAPLAGMGDMNKFSEPRPQSVYVHVSTSAPTLEALLARLDGSASPIAMLAVGGGDPSLSDMLKIAAPLRPLLMHLRFRHVYFEGLDIELPRADGVLVRPLPEGLADNYVCPYAAQIATAYRASPLLREAPRVLLAAWGSWWPGNDALPSRARALAWVKAVHKGEAKWLEHRQVLRAEWWWELRKYRFILNPMGACVQNVRIWEALLMGVIPIGDASSLADRMLQAEGYPLVLVDDWALISEARLATWHKLLLPRVAAIRPLLNARAMHARLVQGLTVNDVLGERKEWESLLPFILLLRNRTQSLFHSISL